jgi:hypothetical protein
VLTADVRGVLTGVDLLRATEVTIEILERLAQVGLALPLSIPLSSG